MVNCSRNCNWKYRYCNVKWNNH